MPAMAARLAPAVRTCGEVGCFVRRLVVPCRRLPLFGDFSVDDLWRGRLDEVCRVVSDSLFLSQSVRQNVDLLVPLGRSRPHGTHVAPGSRARSGTGGDEVGQGRVLHIAAAQLERLRPDERSIATALRTALRGTAAERSRSRGFSVLETQTAAAGSALAEVLDTVWSGDREVARESWTLAVDLCDDGEADVASLRQRLRELQRLYGGVAKAPSSADAFGVVPAATGSITAFLGEGRGPSQEADRDAFYTWASREAAGGEVMRVRLTPAQLPRSHVAVLLHAALDQLHACQVDF